MTEQIQHDPLLIAQHWMVEGKEVAIATLMAAPDTALHRVGSLLVIGEDGTCVGSVWDEAVDADIVTESKAVIETGSPTMLEPAVDHESGFLKIYLERVG